MTLMKKDIKDIILMVKKMEKENFILKMGIFIKEIGKTGNPMEKVFMRQEIENIMGIGERVCLCN